MIQATHCYKVKDVFEAEVLKAVLFCCNFIILGAAIGLLKYAHGTRIGAAIGLFKIKMRTLGAATSIFDENENLTSREWQNENWTLIRSSRIGCEKHVFEVSHTRLAVMTSPYPRKLVR